MDNSTSTAVYHILGNVLYVVYFCSVCIINYLLLEKKKKKKSWAVAARVLHAGFGTSGRELVPCGSRHALLRGVSLLATAKVCKGDRLIWRRYSEVEKLVGLADWVLRLNPGDRQAACLLRGPEFEGLWLPVGWLATGLELA